jgi:hypothetical protein
MLHGGIATLRSLHVLELPVTVTAPPVKIIPARSRINFIFRVVGAMNVDDLANLNLGGALVGQDFRFTLAHD